MLKNQKRLKDLMSSKEARLNKIFKWIAILLLIAFVVKLFVFKDIALLKVVGKTLCDMGVVLAPILVGFFVSSLVFLGTEVVDLIARLKKCQINPELYYKQLEKLKAAFNGSQERLYRLIYLMAIYVFLIILYNVQSNLYKDNDFLLYIVVFLFVSVLTLIFIVFLHSIKSVTALMEMFFLIAKSKDKDQED